MITVFPCSVASDFSRLAIADALVESRLPGRLVGQDQRGIVRERERHADALLFAAAQLLRTLLPLGLEPDEAEQLPRAPAWHSASGSAGHHHRQLDVLERRDARNEIEELEHEPDAAQPVRLRARARSCAVRSWPSISDRPRRGPVDAAEQVEQRGLAAAARAHDRDGRTLCTSHELSRSACTSPAAIL